MSRQDDREAWDDSLDEEPSYDDSLRYGDDQDEEDDYQDFLAREFGSEAGGARLPRWQYATAVLLLVVFVLPIVLYLWMALTS